MGITSGKAENKRKRMHDGILYSKLTFDNKVHIPLSVPSIDMKSDKKKQNIEGIFSYICPLPFY